MFVGNWLLPYIKLPMDVNQLSLIQMKPLKKHSNIILHLNNGIFIINSDFDDKLIIFDPAGRRLYKSDIKKEKMQYRLT